MIRQVWLAVLIWALAAAFGGTQARAQGVPGLSANIAPSIFAADGAGYAQVEVTVVNSGMQARTVTVTATSADGMSSRRYQRQVLVAANSTARVTAAVPRWFYGAYVAVSCEGSDIVTTSLRSATDNTPGCVRFTTAAKEQMDPVIQFQGWSEAKSGWYGWHGGSGPKARYNQLTSGISSWPANGAEYFGIPALVMTAAEWNAAPQGVKKALAEYVAFGGLVGVIGEVTPPANFKAVRPEATRSQTLEMSPTPPVTEYGSTSAPTTSLPRGGRVARIAEQNNRAYAYGYGLFYVLPVYKGEKPAEQKSALPAGETQVTSADGTTVRTARSMVIHTGPGTPTSVAPTVAVSKDMMPARQTAHWQEFVRDCEQLASSDLIVPRYNYGYYRGMGNSKWQDSLKIEHPEGLSRTTMFVMLLLFSVAVVVGIVWLRIAGKKMWILVAMPSLSLVCAVGLVALTMLSEGFGGVSKVVSITHLDQGTQEARTFGIVGIYSPVGLGFSGLKFDAQSQILNPPGESGQESCSVDMTQGSHVENGWVTPRVAGYLNIAKKSARKERLAFVKDGENYSVTNGLGAPVTRVNYCDASGNRYFAEAVAPGATATMTRTFEQIPDSRANPPAWRDNEASLWLRAYCMQTTRVAGSVALIWPGAGEYVCELSGSPFLEDGMGGKGKTSGRAVVYGVTATEIK